jgi:hypothetical protein
MQIQGYSYREYKCDQRVRIRKKEEVQYQSEEIDTFTGFNVIGNARKLVE